MDKKPSRGFTLTRMCAPIARDTSACGLQKLGGYEHLVAESYVLRNMLPFLARILENEKCVLSFVLTGG